MELKEIFDNRFPRNLRIRHRGTLFSHIINNKRVYLFEMNKLESTKFENKFVEKIKKETKYIG